MKNSIPTHRKWSITHVYPTTIKKSATHASLPEGLLADVADVGVNPLPVRALQLGDDVVEGPPVQVVHHVVQLHLGDGQHGGTAGGAGVRARDHPVGNDLRLQKLEGFLTLFKHE